MGQPGVDRRRNLRSRVKTNNSRVAAPRSRPSRDGNAATRHRPHDFDSGIAPTMLRTVPVHPRLRTFCRSAAPVAPVPDAIMAMHPRGRAWLHALAASDIMCRRSIRHFRRSTCVADYTWCWRSWLSLQLIFPASKLSRALSVAELDPLRSNVILQDFRRRWAKLDSVLQNNNIQESWQGKPDSISEWSHCALSPVFVLNHGHCRHSSHRPGLCTLPGAPPTRRRATIGVDRVHASGEYSHELSACAR